MNIIEIEGIKLKTVCDKDNSIWISEKDLIKLLMSKGYETDFYIPSEFRQSIVIVNYSLKSVPELLDRLQTEETFINFVAFNSIRNYYYSKGRPIFTSIRELFNKIKKALIDSDSDFDDLDFIEPVDSVFELSTNGIKKIEKEISESEFSSNSFYEKLNSKLIKLAVKDDKELKSIEKGIKLVLNLIEENKLNLSTSSNIKLNNISGKDYEIYSFSKIIRTKLNNFLKDLNKNS